MSSSNIDNSLIVYSEGNTHIHKKTLAQELGDDETSPISQKGVKNAIDEVNATITNLETTVDSKITEAKKEVNTYTDTTIDKISIILPVKLINESVSATSELPENPVCVYYNIYNNSFYAKDKSGTYHRVWNSFVISVNNHPYYFPSSESYVIDNAILIKNLDGNSVWGNLFIVSKNTLYKPTLLNENIFNSEIIAADETKTIILYSKQDCFIELNNNSSCIINIKRSSVGYHKTANIYRPNITSQLIVKTADNPIITFELPTVIDEVIWENEEPPVFDSYKYYVFNFKEMYIGDTNTVKLLITYKSFPYEKHVEDYVDLGLPSGTLWATKNIGATSPE